MAFIGFIPIILAFIAFFIAILFFIGACLAVIGITGIVMNKMYIKQTHSFKKVSSTPYNVISIVIGLIFMLFPIGYILYSFISSFLLSN